MDLCRRFDLRFPVIQDRLSFDKSMEVHDEPCTWHERNDRDMQDIKDRVYSIQVKLLKLRAPSAADISAHPLMQAPYDKGMCSTMYIYGRLRYWECVLAHDWNRSRSEEKGNDSKD